jgi:hypothetical protein
MEEDAHRVRERSSTGHRRYERQVQGVSITGDSGVLPKVD